MGINLAFARVLLGILHAIGRANVKRGGSVLHDDAVGVNHCGRCVRCRYSNVLWESYETR